MVAALYHQGNEFEARQVYSRQPRDGVPIEFVFGTYIDSLLVIGPASEVRTEAKRVLKTPDQRYTTDFDKAMIEYFAGTESFEDLLDRCVDNSEKTMAPFAAARLQIHEGNWDEAQEHLLAGERLGIIHVSDYYWAKAYLRKYGDRFRNSPRPSDDSPRSSGEPSGEESTGGYES